MKSAVQCGAMFLPSVCLPRLTSVDGNWKETFSSKLFIFLCFIFPVSMWCAIPGRGQTGSGSLPGDRLCSGCQKQPFHLLHSEAARVSMESRSKAGQQLRWQWRRLSHINADTQTSAKFERGSHGEYLQHRGSDNKWLPGFWKEI